MPTIIPIPRTIMMGYMIYDNNNIIYNNSFEYSTRIDNNDVPTDIYEVNTDCDCYNHHINNNINIVTCDYDNYYEENNNHVGCYDVGMVQDDYFVSNDCEENGYDTSLVPCVLSNLGTTSIVDDCDLVCVNDHSMIRCDNTSPTISSMSSLTSFTIPLNLSSLETSSSSNHDTCTDCNSYNGDDTDLDLVLIYLRLITNIHVLLAPPSLETTSLIGNLFRLSSDCGLVCLKYIPVALVANLAATASFPNSLLSCTYSSLPVLDSFVSYWISSNAYVLDTIGSSFNPSDVSAFVNLHKLHWVFL